MYNKKIVTMGGGTGSFMLLSGLKNYPFDISAIVSMADNGGSTGRLRDELGVLPPGDVRQCLVALSEESQILRDLFNYRFDGGDLKGHTMGNLFLSALEKMTGSFSDGLDVAMRLLKIKGNVIPVTQDDANLCLELNNNKFLIGEDAINCSQELKLGVKKIFYKNKVKANNYAVKAIKNADLIVIGPGNFYASVVPNLLISQIAKAVCQSNAKVIFVANLMAKAGNCDLTYVDDYAQRLNYFLKAERLDYVLYNITQPSKNLIDKYFKHGEKLIECESNLKQPKSYKIIKADLLNHKVFSYGNQDALATHRSFIRHDSEKIAKVIMYLSEIDNYFEIIKEVS